MTYYQILHKGEFSSDQVQITYREGRIQQHEEALQFISTKWKKAQAENSELFNGRLYRLDNHTVTKNLLQLSVSDTDYKEYVGTRDIDFVNKFGMEFTSNPISVGIVLITLDNKIILGRRTNDVDIEKSKIAVMAGYADPSLDCKENKPDLFYAVKREVSEELLIDMNSISNLKSLGLVYNSCRNQTYMPFQGQIQAYADDIQNFNKKEFSQIIMIDNEKQTIIDFIGAMKELLSDITVPTLKIYAELYENGI